MLPSILKLTKPMPRSSLQKCSPCSFIYGTGRDWSRVLKEKKWVKFAFSEMSKHQLRKRILGVRFRDESLKAALHIHRFERAGAATK